MVFFRVVQGDIVHFNSKETSSMLFSQKTIDFLVENRLQNSKAWFEENKHLYTAHVIAPLISLTEALTPTLLEIDGKLICSPKVGGSISRIYRDCRFSKDKSLYRDQMWTMFVREKNIGLPEFFFVVSPQDFMYGCGYYAASTQSMENMRNLIKTGDKHFKAALKAYENQDIFQLDGDLYKKSRHPDMPDNLKDWLDRKTICFLHTGTDFDLLYSDELANKIAHDYKTLAPIYNFLIKAEESVNS
jgi:uncharacterized protein (TIGR02453 family)